ncbi:hypothetical protein V8C35DRAFT_216039 [Trichoderma chlorosporum]
MIQALCIAWPLISWCVLSKHCPQREGVSLAYGDAVISLGRQGFSQGINVLSSSPSWLSSVSRLRFSRQALFTCRKDTRRKQRHPESAATPKENSDTGRKMVTADT